VTVGSHARREQAGIPRQTVAVSAALGLVAGLAAAVSGHFSIGVGLGAGLLIGSFNGYLLVALLDRNVPFVSSSIVRLAAVSAAAILVAILIGSAMWSVLIGVAAAQLVMVATSVRQGLRT
jgi:hypothetical protein